MKNHQRSSASREKVVHERVHVHCRVRPFTKRTSSAASSVHEEDHHHHHDQEVDAEAAASQEESVFHALADDGKKCKFRNPASKEKNKIKTFTFDTFFDMDATQEEVYEQAASSIVQGVLNGYNGTVFAYGQTGTGKTHTMMGASSAPLESMGGIIPRALNQIFDTVAQMSNEFIYEISVSYVQLYCELLQDLLEPDRSKTLTIREDSGEAPGKGGGTGVFIQGLSSFKVNSKMECLNLLRIGAENRAVAETKMNAQSSRSHAALLLRVERRPRPGVEGGTNAPKKVTGKLFIVDLAGSERVRTSGSAQGDRFRELKSINLSLSALGNCISALAEKKRHIPFRDSKLTRLLQDSLGGNARTALVINVSPSAVDASETLSSLMFGQRAMAVETSAKRNVEVDYKALYTTIQSTLDQKDDEIHRLQIASQQKDRETQRMRDELIEAKRAQQVAEVAMRRAAAAAAAEEEKPAEVQTFLTAPDEKNTDKITEEIASLKKAYEQQIVEERKRSKKELDACNRRAATAEAEWNDIEYSLRCEREEHLRTCIQLKECRAQINKLDKDMTERISELTQEVTELKERAEEKAETSERTEHLEQALAKSGGIIKDLKASYVQKALNLERVYDEKIRLLLERVAQLESAQTMVLERMKVQGEEHLDEDDEEEEDYEEGEEEVRSYGGHNRRRRVPAGYSGRRGVQKQAYGQQRRKGPGRKVPVVGGVRGLREMRNRKRTQRPREGNRSRRAAW
eukprot:g2733.t1